MLIYLVIQYNVVYLYYNNNNKNNIMKRLERYTVKMLTLLMFLFMVNLINSQNSRFGEVDLTVKYEQDIQDLGDGDSCTVRLIASFFNIEYKEAYNILKSEGRITGRGATISIFVRSFNKTNKDYYVNSMVNLNKIKEGGYTLKEFMTYEAKKNTSYILISKGHIYYMNVYEMNENGKGLNNTLYGNDKDRGKKVLFYMPIKKR